MIFFIKNAIIKEKLESFSSIHYIMNVVENANNAINTPIPLLFFITKDNKEKRNVRIAIATPTVIGNLNSIG